MMIKIYQQPSNNLKMKENVFRSHYRTVITKRKSKDEIYRETLAFFGATNGFPTFTQERVEKAIEIVFNNEYQRSNPDGD